LVDAIVVVQKLAELFSVGLNQESVVHVPVPVGGFPGRTAYGLLLKVFHIIVGCQGREGEPMATPFF
jgi:D-serine dehydratase